MEEVVVTNWVFNIVWNPSLAGDFILVDLASNCVLEIEHLFDITVCELGNDSLILLDFDEVEIFVIPEMNVLRILHTVVLLVNLLVYILMGYRACQNVEGVVTLVISVVMHMGFIINWDSINVCINIFFVEVVIF